VSAHVDGRWGITLQNVNIVLGMPWMSTYKFEVSIALLGWKIRRETCLEISVIE